MPSAIRRRKRILFNAVLASAAATLTIPLASADPLVNVTMLGWDITQLGPAPSSARSFLPNVQVNPGDTVVYSLFTYLSPTGTYNSNYSGHALTQAVNGVDGIQSLSFDAYQLAADQIQVDFKNAYPGAVSVSSSGATLGVGAAEGVYLSTTPSNWRGSLGNSGGSLGHQSAANLPGARTGPSNDILAIRPILPPGTFRGISSSQAQAFLGTGFFVVSSTGDGSLSTVKMRYTPNANGQGGVGGGFTLNNHTDLNNLTDAEEAGPDPFTAYAALTLSTTSVTSWNTDAPGNWSQAGNWTTAVPNNPSAAPLLGSIITATRQVTLDVPVTVASLTIASLNPYTLAGPNSFTASTVNINGGSHLISAPVVLNSGLTITAAPSSAVSLSGPITGSGGLTKSGSGALILSSSNAYIGGTQITGGMVQINSDSNLGDPASTLTFTGGRLQTSTSLTLSRPIVLGGLGATLDTNGFNSTVSSNVTGTAGLSKVGPGNLLLTSPTTFSGPTTIFQGSLILIHPLALQDSTLDIRTPSGLNLNGLSATLGGLTGAGSLDLGDSSMNTSIGNNGANTSYSGVLTGSGSFTKVGSGTMILTGTHIYTGTTSLNGGILKVASTSNLGNPASPSPLVFNGGELLPAVSFSLNRGVNISAGGGTVDTNGLSLTLSGTISGSGALTKTGSGTLVFTGPSNFATLALASGNIAGTVNANLYDMQNGVVSATFSGTGALVKSTAGTVTLTGTSTYSGTTAINGGTLLVSSSANLGNDSPTNSLVLNGGTFQGTASFLMNRGLVLNGATGVLNINGGSVTTIAGGVSGTGGLTTTGSGGLVLAGPSTYTGPTIISGAILDTGGPNVLSPASDFTVNSGPSGFFVIGGLYIRAFNQTVGTLAGSGEVSLASPSAILTVGANNGSSTFAGYVTGSGGLTKTGSGDLTLSYPRGDDYTGPTNVTGGRLIIDPSGIVFGAPRIFNVSGGSLINNGILVGTINLNAGGTLDGSSSSGGFTDTTITVNSGGTVRGTGNYRPASVPGLVTYSGQITLNSGATISPGNSPGTLTSNSGLINSGAIYDFDIRDADGPSGTGTDLWHITNQLSILASAGAPIFINPDTLNPSNTPGLADNFDPTQPYQWSLIHADTGITGFSPDDFSIDPSQFLNPTNGGSFSITETPNDLFLNFTPVPEPSLTLLVLTTALLHLTRRRRSRQVTNDQDS